jgi:hypothetical protein
MKSTWHTARAIGLPAVFGALLARAIAVVACALLTCSFTALPSRAADAPAGGTGTAGIKAIYDALRTVELDPSRSVKVDNLQVGRDVMDITLVSGRLFFAKPWKEGASPTAAFFVGEGRAKFTPVNKLESHEFAKAYGDKEAMDEKFGRAFIRFDDDLYESLKAGLAPDTADEDTRKAFEKRQEALEDLLFNVEFPMIADQLSPVKRNADRLVEFETGKEGWISYFHAPQQVEENTLFRHKRVGFSDLQNSTLLSQWHDREDYASGKDLDRQDKDVVSVDHYDGDFTVNKAGLLLEAKVRMDVTARVDQLAAAAFDFITYMDFVRKEKPFKVRSVTLADGSPLEYLHDNYQLLVQFDRPLAAGEKRSIVVAYTADFIRANPSIGQGQDLPTRLDFLDASSSTFTLLNTFPWFPQYGYLRRYSLDWTIRVPKPYLAVASGVTEKRWEEGDYNVLHSVEKEKVALASWLFGKYVMYTDERDTARPRIFVWGLPKQQNNLKGLYDEARNVVNWYQQWASPYPYEELDIAQMGFFYGFGQAPPGLVQLTGEAFLSQPQIVDLASSSPRFDPTFVHAFVCHEIGHQWFGHVVSWVSLHDQWLSESYTEYMSGLYVGNLLGEKAFDKKLREWNDNAQKVEDGGSIWLGQRNGEDYINVTYNKGPYVLHMLRLTMQSQFGPEEGDRKFFASMKAFLDKYRHQNASTTDFVNVVNQTTKMDFRGFFDQWFHDIGIPELTFAYSVRPTEDGKFLVSVKVTQADRDNLKQLFLPVGLQFNGKMITKMMPIRDAESSWQIKVPQNPEKVVPNADGGILARVKVEKS